MPLHLIIKRLSRLTALTEQVLTAAALAVLDIENESAEMVRSEMSDRVIDLNTLYSLCLEAARATIGC